MLMRSFICIHRSFICIHRVKYNGKISVVSEFLKITMSKIKFRHKILMSILKENYTLHFLLAQNTNNWDYLTI